MSLQLRSDNFGNKIKCIECINGINNDALTYTNIMKIINILTNNLGFKYFISNYLIQSKNIDMKSLDELYNFANTLNTNNNNNDGNIVSNIFELDNDVLTRIVSNLDIKSIINFEISSKHGCYISRQQICLSNNFLSINVNWNDKMIPNDNYRFKRINKVVLTQDILNWTNKNVFKFLHDIAPNVKYFQNEIYKYCDIEMDRFESLETYHDGFNHIPRRSEQLFVNKKFIDKIYHIKRLHAEMDWQYTDEEVKECLNTLNKYEESSLKSIIWDGFTENTQIILKVTKDHIKTLESLRMTEKRFMNIMRHVGRSNDMLSLINVKELAFHDRYPDDLIYHANAFEMVKSHFECKKLEKLCLGWRHNVIWLNGISMNIYGKLKSLAIIMESISILYFNNFMKLIKQILNYKQKHNISDRMVITLYMYIYEEEWNGNDFYNYFNSLCQLKNDHKQSIDMILIIWTDGVFISHEKTKMFKNIINKDHCVLIFYDKELNDDYKFTVLTGMNRDYPGLSYIEKDFQY